MNSIIVAGIDSVVGANLAAELSERHHVIGLSFDGDISIADVQTAICRVDDLDAIREWVNSTRPDAVVYCGLAARSSWETTREQTRIAGSYDHVPAGLPQRNTSVPI